MGNSLMKGAAMSKYCKLTYLTVTPGTAGAALARIEAWLPSTRLQGRLLGCLQSEIGLLNRIVLIQSYETAGAALEDQAEVLKQANPYGIGDLLRNIDTQIHAPFPNSPLFAPGSHGPVYEIRTYTLKPGGVQPTFDAWAKVLEQRMQVSPLFGVMFGLDAALTRFVHIWPYADLEQRMALRAQAVQQGVWPPPGGIDHLVEMRSEIFLPATFSPLR
jgi:hypothetical protein